MGVRWQLSRRFGWVETVPRPMLLAAAALGLPMMATGLAYLLTEQRQMAPEYSLAAVRQGQAVPRAFLRTIPETVVTETATPKRKTMFFRLVLPLVLQVNERIKRDRDRLVAFEAATRAGRQPTRRDRAWLVRLAERYGTQPGDIDTLKRRLDVVPPALALAQAAVESGWGSSRFARHGNALFGLWTWNDETGLVPRERDDGARHAVRRYDTLLASVRSYIHTLNTHPAYQELRRLRAEMREAGDRLDARRLVAGLRPYAQKVDYVDVIKGVITRNRLWQFDHAALAP